MYFLKLFYKTYLASPEQNGIENELYIIKYKKDAEKLITEYIKSLDIEEYEEDVDENLEEEYETNLEQLYTLIPKDKKHDFKNISICLDRLYEILKNKIQPETIWGIHFFNIEDELKKDCVLRID